MKALRQFWILGWFLLVSGTSALAQQSPIEIGSRRELFLDQYLIEKLDHTQLQVHEPRDEGTVLRFDQPWEGIHCGYCTMIRDGATMRVYYRGMPAGTVDGTAGEVTCVADSDDGIHWTRPKLNLSAKASKTARTAGSVDGGGLLAWKSFVVTSGVRREAVGSEVLLDTLWTSALFDCRSTARLTRSPH